MQQGYAKLPCWLAVIGARVWWLGVKWGVGGNTGAANGPPVGDCTAQSWWQISYFTYTQETKRNAVIFFCISDRLKREERRATLCPHKCTHDSRNITLYCFYNQEVKYVSTRGHTTTQEGQSAVTVYTRQPR